MIKYKFKTCTEACEKLDVSCPNSDCRYSIPSEKNLNCTLIAIKKNGGPMTLRQIGDCMDCSFVRVKQILDETLPKLQEDFQNGETISKI